MATINPDETDTETAEETTSIDPERNAFIDKYPTEARVTRLAFTVAFVALGIGGLFGLIQALHRTGAFRGFISNADYYTVLTGHGVLLVLVFTTFFISGLFNWAITRSLDQPSVDPRVIYSAVILMTVGTVLAAAAILGGLFPNVPLSADVLFTFYPPLQAHPIFYIGAALIIVGSWVGGLDWFRRLWAWRSNNPDDRIPIQAFMVLATMVMWYVATIGIAIEVVVFLIPWSLGLISQVDPLLTRTLFWFFGHPVVYFWLLPAYLGWYTIMPKLAGGRLFSDPLARVVFILFVILSTPVGFHHQYVDPGIPEGFKFVAMTNTMFLLLPSLLTAFTVVASLEHAARQRGAGGLVGDRDGVDARRPRPLDELRQGGLDPRQRPPEPLDAGLGRHRIVPAVAEQGEQRPRSRFDRAPLDPEGVRRSGHDDRLGRDRRVDVRVRRRVHRDRELAVPPRLDRPHAGVGRPGAPNPLQEVRERNGVEGLVEQALDDVAEPPFWFSPAGEPLGDFALDPQRRRLLEEVVGVRRRLGVFERRLRGVDLRGRPVVVVGHDGPREGVALGRPADRPHVQPDRLEGETVGALVNQVPEYPRLSLPARERGLRRHPVDVVAVQLPEGVTVLLDLVPGDVVGKRVDAGEIEGRPHDVQLRRGVPFGLERRVHTPATTAAELNRPGPPRVRSRSQIFPSKYDSGTSSVTLASPPWTCRIR